MIKKASLLLGVAGMLITTSCSSTTADHSANHNSSANSVPGVTVAANTSNANSTVVTNGMFVPAQGADANVNSAIAPADGIQPPNMMHGRLEKMRQSGASAEKVDVAALAMKNARPAPDNSTFTSYLSDAGYEIRTFKNHPQLLKVEKKTESNGNQTLKIFLRNGQVVERPGKDIPILSNASAAAILSAGGISQPPQQRPPAPAGAVPTKKAGD